MINFDERQYAADMRSRALRATESAEVECPDCGGDGKVGYRVGDDRPEAECELCYGAGEVSMRRIDERDNGPRF